MTSVTFTELRNHARKYFDAVERGESLTIYRRSKPVARLIPHREGGLSRWRDSRPLKLAGVSLSRLIIAERQEGD